MPRTMIRYRSEADGGDAKHLRLLSEAIDGTGPQTLVVLAMDFPYNMSTGECDEAVRQLSLADVVVM